MKLQFCISLLFLFFCSSVSASDPITIEPDGSSYYYVSHYEVEIDATAEQIWPVLVDLGAWMYEFELSPLSGEPGKQGHVLQLYPNQKFYIQITKVVPNELLVIANLPSTFQGELSTGVGIISLHEVNNRTSVSMISSRRYSQVGDDDHQMMSRRASSSFQETADARQDRFFTKLKELVETSNR